MKHIKAITRFASNAEIPEMQTSEQIQNCPNPTLKRKFDGFVWTSGTQRFGHPLYWYSRQGNELWFVNSTPAVLKKLVASGAGSATLDGHEVFTTSATPDRVYVDIQPGEGVLVDEFDGFYDLDLLCYTEVLITDAHGQEHQYGSSGKGGSKTCRLLSTGDLKRAQ